jgi:alanine dehydrogenase
MLGSFLPSANLERQMIVGLPKEIKNHEYRVGLTPSSVRELTSRGHKVLVQKNAGLEIGLSDEQYVAAGAQLVDTAKEIFSLADM